MSSTPITSAVAATPPDTQKTEKGTAYVVLEQLADGKYETVADIAATSANAAIRKAAESAGAGTYIAVPARSFALVKVTIVPSKIVKLG